MTMLVIGAAYFAAGKIGLSLAFAFPSASPVWPPTGIALASLVIFGSRYWPAIFAGAFLVNATTAGSVATSFGIAAGNTIEAVVAAACIHAFGGKNTFHTVNGVLAFAFTCILTTTISATIGVLSLYLGGFASQEILSSMWITWWLGDLAGALIIAPLIIASSDRMSLPWNMRTALETTLFAACVIVINVLIFGEIFNGSEYHSFAYFALLPVLWAAIRFGPHGTAASIFILSCMATVGTLRGWGPFAGSRTNHSLLLLQTFLGVASLTGLSLAASTHERKVSTEFLEEKVKDRTKDLESARNKDRGNLQRLIATISHLPMGAILMDEHNNIMEINQRYCDFFSIGLTAEEVKCIPHDELTRRFKESLLEPEEHMKKVDRTLEERATSYDQEIHLKDGRIIVRDYVAIEDEGVYRGQLFLYRDVTKERRMDKAKSEFMSLASHQLRTPLTAIRWSLGRLNRDLIGKVNTSHGMLLTEGQKAAHRMSETIDTMLKISKFEAAPADLVVTRFNLREVLREKEILFRSQYEAKKQSFKIDCPHDLYAETDVTFFQEILKNLLQNAVKYTPENGKVILRGRNNGDSVVIEVEDNGCGIPVDQQRHVFQKFFRAQNVVQHDTTGTGLGLYLVALISEVLGAEIEFQSEEGKGTVFRLTLPLPVSNSIDMTAQTDISVAMSAPS